MSSPVQQIKERLAIEDIISSYVKLEPTGLNYKARCPFHNEKTASFFVSSDRGNYYCFGCGAKGDIFTFVQEFEGLDFKGALKLLADKAQVDLGNFNSKEESEKDRLLMIMESATKFFEANLAGNEQVLSYLFSRGLLEKTIKDFRIGYVTDSWDSLYFHLKKQKFSDSDIEKAGLIKKGETKFYDRFRGRVIFPLMDSSGRVIAFSGRIFVDDGKSAKYLNSPETAIFNKSKVLYGINKAKESIKKNNFSILVEGQMDLVLSHQAGFRNTVATSGTALSESAFVEGQVSNLSMISKLSQNLILAFDADKAGISASERAAKIALREGMDVKVALMPDGVDPADLISKFGIDKWKEAIRGSKHVIDFMLAKAIASSDDSRKLGRTIREKVLPYLFYVSSSIEKMQFVKKIADATGVSEQAVLEDLKTLEHDKNLVQIDIYDKNEERDRFFRRDSIERRILGIYLWQKSLPHVQLNIGQLIEDLAVIKNDSPEGLLDSVDSIKEDLIFEAEVFYKDHPDLHKEVKELMGSFKEEYLKELLSKKMQELRMAEKHSDSTLIKNILIEYQDLSNQIQEIKNGRFVYNYEIK